MNMINELTTALTNLNYISLAVGAVILFFAIKGYRRGLAKLSATILSMALTFYLVSVVTPYITDYLAEKTTLQETVKEKLDKQFEERNSKRDNTLYENQIATIESYEMPRVMKNVLRKNNNPRIYEEIAVTIFEDYVSVFLSRLILHLSAFVSTYLMVMLFLKATLLSMKLISHIPVFKGINKILGFIFGAAEGVFVLWFLLIIGMLFAGDKVLELASTNSVIGTLYNNNMILELVFDLI